MSNDKLWKLVEETNPANAKFVNVGRGYTTVDAYSQIERATQVFGPIGIGWGYDYTIDDSKENNIRCDFKLWFIWDGKRSEDIPVTIYMPKLIGKNPKPDMEAGKKAVTDALTKSLSYVGFNADIFRGKFDDNRYVDEMNRKHREQPKQQPQTQQTPPEPGPEEDPNMMSEKQRKTIWAISVNLWGQNDAKSQLEDVCNGPGWKLKSMTRQQASTLITTLKSMQEKK